MKLLVIPGSVEGTKRLPLVTDCNGELYYELDVDLNTFPDGADRDDARNCGYLDISPYWEEPHKLCMIKVK